MNWNKITQISDIEEIKQSSENKRALIFKHSTRCSISSMALNRLERSWSDADMKELTPYFLDLIAHRDISNQVAETFGVRHESPQVLVIENGNCIYDNSHMGISYQELKGYAKELAS